MPGEAAGGYGETQDIFPVNEDEHSKLLTKCLMWWQHSEDARKPFDTKWQRFYQLYRNWVEDRKPGDWQSRVFIPMCFWVIETIAPRLVAQLPKFLVKPMGPEDVEPAKVMETLLEHSATESGLFQEMVNATKSALMYGTGILQTFYEETPGVKTELVPITEQVPQSNPIIDPETGAPLLDPDGMPVVDETEVDVPVVDPETGQPEFESVPVPFNVYEGPMAKAVDIANFYFSPEAQDIDSAHYVIHRTFPLIEDFKAKVEDGTYRLDFCESVEGDSFLGEDPMFKRLDAVGLGGGGSIPEGRVELLNFWTKDKRIITVYNRKAVVRVQKNPFNHGQKPYVRIVDYNIQGEPWGIGEIEPLEGLQDLQNALTNSRIDNIRLLLNAMFVVNTNNLEDVRDLQMKPGGVIRTKGDFTAKEVIERIDLGDVTSSAFAETEQVERTAEKVSSVSGYQMGLDSPAMTDTATGMQIITEQGSSKFALKTKMAELGWKRLGRQFGSIIQQFLTSEKMLRIAGPMGQLSFQAITPESIQGALDFDIEPASAVQSETVKREQSLSLLREAVQIFPPQMDPFTGQPTLHPAVMAAWDDVLEAFDKKDKFRYGANPMAQMPGMPMGAPGEMGQLPPDALAGQNGAEPSQEQYQ